MAKRRKTGQDAVLRLWKGIFSFSNEALVLRTRAISREKALVNFCKQIADKDGVHVSHVIPLFDGSKNNFEITLEK